MLLDLEKIINNCWSGKLASWQLKIISDWPLIVGNICKQARVEKIYEETVILGVYDTCWLQQLHLLSNMIIRKINLYLGDDYIKQIRLKYVQKHHFPKIKPLPAVQLYPHKLSIKEEKALNKILDPELKSSIQQFLNRCHRENS